MVFALCVCDVCEIVKNFFWSFFLILSKGPCLCVWVCSLCLQETLEDLAESEQYTEARSVLDSVKLEG